MSWESRPSAVSGVRRMKRSELFWGSWWLILKIHGFHQTTLFWIWIGRPGWQERKKQKKKKKSLLSCLVE
jgi:hypothetical protein